MNILITGATGFIGGEIIKYFKEKNYKITILTRDRKKVFDDYLDVFENIDEISNESFFDIIINLAGAPISKRWSDSYKIELIESRVNVTKSIYKLISRLDKKPQKIISASAIGYYGNHGDDTIDESSSFNEGFTHDLCLAWESEALKLKDFVSNVVIIRLGVVLGINKGILKETLPVFKLGLGGKVGSGEQYLSWVHVEDVVGAISFLIKNGDGVYNITSPNPVKNKLWAEILGKTLKRPSLIPLPEIIIKVAFGEMGENLLLSGQKVLPNKIVSEGFKFKYSKLEDALCDIINDEK